MTLTAIGAEIVVVRIIMAIVAVFERDVGELLKLFSVPPFLFVAFFAVNRFMLSNQFEIGFVVVEITGWCKLLCLVTLVAIIPQCFLVNILVTGIAIGTQPQISVFPFSKFGISDKIGFMAIPAIYPSMGPC